MDRNRWADLVLFAAVAQAGSFTRAAAELDLTPSAVSHAMRQLEERLGVRLLNRTTRSLAPTQAGERLLATLRPAVADVDGAIATLLANRERPAGRLRISAHRSAAFGHVVPRLARFERDYPDVELEIVVDDDLVDIVAERFDAGIRRSPALEDDMIAVRLDEGEALHFVAAPAYLARFGTPAEPADILRHRCVNYRYPSSGRPHRWDFVRGAERLTLDVPAIFLTNDVDLLKEAALSGLGLAIMLGSMAEEPLAEGRLIDLLPQWRSAVPANHLYYAGRRNVSPALRAFIDAMKAPVEPAGASGA